MRASRARDGARLERRRRRAGGADPRGVRSRAPRQLRGGPRCGGARALLWLAPNGWQLRVGAERPHHFTGTIEVTRGELLAVDGALLEADDRFEQKDGRLTIFFHAGRDLDGVSMVVGGEACLRVDVAADGQASPDRFFVGRDGVHPDRVPFTICAGASSFEE